MTVLVRPVTEADYEAAGAVCVDAYRADGQLGDPTETGHDYASVLSDVAGRSGHGDVLIAEDADTSEIVGCVTFVRPGTRYAELARSGEAEFRMLAVAPSAQGRGIGRALVQACIDRASAAGYTAVVICVRDFSDPAKRVYQRMGFVRAPDLDWSPVPGVSLEGLRLPLNG